MSQQSENTYDWHKNVVQKHYAYLSENMQPDEIINHFITRGCFIPRQGRDMKAKLTLDGRNEEFITAFMRRPSEDFYKFLFLLHITLQDHILNRLLETAAAKLDKELVFECRRKDCRKCKKHLSKKYAKFPGVLGLLRLNIKSDGHSSDPMEENLPSTSAKSESGGDCEYWEDEFIIYAKRSKVDIKTPGYADESEATTSKDKTDRKERVVEPGETPSTSTEDPSVNEEEEEEEEEEEVDDKWYEPCAVRYYLEDGAKYQDNWELSCGVRVMETADWSGFRVITWGSWPHVGEAGLFQKENNRRFVYFALWCNEGDRSYCVEDHSLGEGVVMALDKKIVMRMEKAISWREDEDVKFFVKGEKKRLRWKMSYSFEYQGRREYIGTFRQSLDIGHPLRYSTFWSGIELKGTSEKRSAEFFESKLIGKLIPYAQFLNLSEGHFESTTGCKTGSI